MDCHPLIRKVVSDMLNLILCTGADTISVITKEISTVGFPIVACAAMFWQMRENLRQHKEESEKWVEALNNNTLVIQRLVDNMDKED